MECEKFIWDRWFIDKPAELTCGDTCHIISVLSGELQIEGDAVEQPAGLGQTLLIPASLAQVKLIPQGEVVMLDAYLPD